MIHNSELLRKVLHLSNLIIPFTYLFYFDSKVEALFILLPITSIIKADEATEWLNSEIDIILDSYKNEYGYSYVISSKEVISYLQTASLIQQKCIFILRFPI